ncbi:unnamed protein product [Moneuplotes crassus]|uniref:Uncharacterized protein n=1 Tax=Euplotes crassus TaxID=5936 RepID=A0AAD1X3U4_EUPCR|nr:unnamed protein product [Moneuplotes crassus]
MVIVAAGGCWWLLVVYFLAEFWVCEVCCGCSALFLLEIYCSLLILLERGFKQFNCFFNFICSGFHFLGIFECFWSR